MTSEVKDAWCAVPNKTIVQIRSRGDSRPRFAYRYNDRGRLFYYSEAWDPGQLVWMWDKESASVCDFVTIAPNVRPDGTQEVWARICGLDASTPGETVITGVTIPAPKPGDVIGWYEVPDNALVMNNENTAVYLKLQGRGDTVRGVSSTALYRYESIASCWHWTNRVVTPFVTVVAVDVPDNVTDSAIAALIGGPNTRTWSPRSAAAIMTFKPGDKTTWDMVPDGTIVMIDKTASCALKLQGRGDYVRSGNEYEGRYTRVEEFWNWSTYTSQKEPVTIVAVGLQDDVTNETIREHIGGKSNTKWPLVRAGDKLAVADVPDNAIFRPATDPCTAVRRGATAMWIRCEHVGSGKVDPWRSVERCWNEVVIVALDAPASATLTELTALVDGTPGT